MTTTNGKRRDEYLGIGVYLPPSKVINETSQILSEQRYAVGPGTDKIHRDFHEEEASVNLGALIKAARVEKSLSDNLDTV